jgi:pyruvate dehydrogenase E1 component alpha subunit
MSDPGTTYRTREEVQRMRSTQDPIRGLQRYIEEWGLATEQELESQSIRRESEVEQWGLNWPWMIELWGH